METSVMWGRLGKTKVMMAMLSLMILAPEGLAGPEGPPVDRLFKPLVSGKRGVVVAGHPLVAGAGMRIGGWCLSRTPRKSQPTFTFICS